MKLAQDTKERLLKQIDFYFSDSNLPFDRFLKGECQAEGGWVDLSVVIAFARVQSILGQEWKNPDAVSDDAIDTVAAVMQESDMVEISEDGYQIRRKDMPTDWTEVIAAVAARTVHVALLPYDTTLEKLAKYFSKHGQVNQVRLLKYSDMDGSGVFRGAALVEMSSAEEASVLLDLDLPYEGASLRVQTKASYEDLLEKDRKERKDAQHVDVFRPVLTVDGLPPDPEPLNQENRNTQPASDPSPSANASDEAKEDKSGSATARTSAGEDKPFVVQDEDKELLVRFDVIGETDGLGSGKNLRDTFGGQTKGVRFVEYTMGSSTGVIRFMAKNNAEALLEQGDAAGEIEVEDGKKFKLTLLAGEEEAAVWKRIHGDVAKRDAAKRNKRPIQGGRGGGRHPKRGRR